MEHYIDWAEAHDENPKDYVTGIVASETNNPVRPKSVASSRPQSVVIFALDNASHPDTDNNGKGIRLSSTSSARGAVSPVDKRVSALAGGSGRPRSQFFPELEINPVKEHSAVNMSSSSLNAELVDPRSKQVFKKESVAKYYALTLTLAIGAIVLIAVGSFCFSQTENNGPAFCTPLFGGGSVALIILGGFILLFGMVSARYIVNPPTYATTSAARR